MGIILDINTLPNNKAIAIVMLTSIAILGPFQIIYQFAPSTFSHYNIPTLLLLSSSCGIPIIVSNTIFVYFALGQESYQESKWPTIGILSSVISMMIIYLPIVFNILEPLSRLASILLSTGIQLLFILILSTVGIFNLINNKRNNTPASESPGSVEVPLQAPKS